MSWLAELRRRQEDRGMMAALRCGLVEGKRHRAWPALSRLGVSVDNEVSLIIAGLFALHPEESATGNFGGTCKRIESARNENSSRDEDSKLTPTERRFQHLLAAERGSELHERVTRMVLLAKAQGVPVNYVQLEDDMRMWGDRTKQRWASSFWSPQLSVTESGDRP